MTANTGEGVATIVARELGWDDGRREQEISLVKAALSLPQGLVKESEDESVQEIPARLEK